MRNLGPLFGFNSRQIYFLGAWIKKEARRRIPPPPRLLPAGGAPYAPDPVGQIFQDRPNKPNCRSLGRHRDRIGTQARAAMQGVQQSRARSDKKLPAISMMQNIIRACSAVIALLNVI